MTTTSSGGSTTRAVARNVVLLSARVGEPDVHVVLVVRVRDHDVAPPVQPGRVAHEDHLSPGGHEAVEKILGKVMVDLARRNRCAQVAVETRVVDVDIEPVLVGGMLV